MQTRVAKRQIHNHRQTVVFHNILQKCKLGLDIANGEMPQLLVPSGYWKAAVLESGEFGLLGEGVAPGFDFRDMELAQSEDFRQRFPDLWDQLAPYVKP
ncbi:cupin domain-containing protein [Okeania sp. SIO1F9]|uniref:cupin domain-containing protein n=1 Tax=Okeania sp. SIO1F9 TaxID=2607813 RepID=UPI00257BD376|nr:cupin domain-containing protein [Okeania sp. SIO1F9]